MIRSLAEVSQVCQCRAGCRSERNEMGGNRVNSDKESVEADPRVQFSWSQSSYLIVQPGSEAGANRNVCNSRGGKDESPTSVSVESKANLNQRRRLTPPAHCVGAGTASQVPAACVEQTSRCSHAMPSLARAYRPPPCSEPCLVPGGNASLELHWLFLIFDTSAIEVFAPT